MRILAIRLFLGACVGTVVWYLLGQLLLSSFSSISAWAAAIAFVVLQMFPISGVGWRKR